MIKIFNKNELTKKQLQKILKNVDVWSFPIEELEYLLEEHKKESFVLIDKRLYEMEGY